MLGNVADEILDELARLLLLIPSCSGSRSPV
jgi:hypothetical protein